MKISKRFEALHILQKDDEDENRKALLESNISASQMFKEKVLRDGYIPLDDGDLFYVVARINTTNFEDMGKGLIEQLKNEDKYDDYIGFLSYSADPPYTVEMLPIYGSSSKYITKWFRKDAEECIKRDLSDKGMRLLKRAHLDDRKALLESNSADETLDALIKLFIEEDLDYVVEYALEHGEKPESIHPENIDPEEIVTWVENSLALDISFPDDFTEEDKVELVKEYINRIDRVSTDAIRDAVMDKYGKFLDSSYQ